MKPMNMEKNSSPKKNMLCSWSGGKDSCFALMQAIQQGYHAAVLLNVLNEKGQISRSHGIPTAILQLQAKAAGLPIQLVASSWADYEEKFTATLGQLNTLYLAILIYSPTEIGKRKCAIMQALQQFYLYGSKTERH